MKRSTRILDNPQQSVKDVAAPETVEMGMVNPWRIGLTILPMKVQLIIDLTGTLTVGRSSISDSMLPDIDLKPFNAEELGVSRQHLCLKLEDSNVVVIDNNSSNGTMLNNALLKPGQAYIVHHADMLMLGGLIMEIKLLINPLI